MKVCTKCKIEKSLDFFTKSSNTKDGYRYHCKECRKSSYDNKKEELKLQMKEYYQSNREKVLLQQKEYRDSNEQKIQLRKREWFENNKHKVNAACARRRTAKLKATPSWLTDDMWLEIDKLYELAFEMTESQGISHHVDHIIPLQGKQVCGLHVPWNLQVIPATENLRKGNR